MQITPKDVINFFYENKGDKFPFSELITEWKIKQLKKEALKELMSDSDDFIYKAPNPPEKQPKKEYEILSSCPIEGDIHSVKRLSDGEIFTIGDKVRYHENSTIERLFISKGLMLCDLAYTSLYMPGSLYSGNVYNVNIMSLLKLKQPLFITEDGKNIYADDTYFHVSKDWQICEYNATGRGHYPREYCKTNFSTKSAAENYILMNKPLLSANDIIAIGHTWLLGEGGDESRYCPYFPHKNLIDLAKSKLNFD